MQKILFLLISLLVMTSCKQDKKTIEFKTFTKTDLGNISKDNATMHANAEFMNYTDEEFNLKDLVLDFSIDGKDVGTIVTKTDKVIKPDSEFSIPVKYTYETNSFVEEGHDPSGNYSFNLQGDLTLKNSKNEEVTAEVKYSATYEYQTKKEARDEKRETRKEERQRKREERKLN